MKQIYSPLTIVLILFFTQNFVQAQELLLAKRVGSDSPDSFLEKGNSIALDDTGNIFITGTIGSGSSGAIFGEGETNETTLNINGSFVAKFAESGELLWVQQMGASYNSITSYAIDVDMDGNVYASGTFFQEATFGLGQVNESTLTGTSGEIFIAKYDSDGNLLWAINEGGENDDNPGGRGLKVDNDGNVYLTGSFWGTVTFGEGETTETTLVGENTDIFVAKYDTNGSLIWINKAGGSSFDGGKNIDLDEDGNIFLTGNYFNSAVFGEGLSNETSLNDGNESSFLAKFDNDGIFLWAIEPFSSGTGDISGDIQIDQEGSVLFTGSFFGSISLGNGTANETQLTGTGLDEIIVAKYNSEGQFIWAKTAESTGDDRGVSVAVDTISNVFITGYYGNQIQFGSGERNDTTIVNSGSSDIFIAKFSPSGEFIWVTSAGGSEWEQGSDIQVDKSGYSYVTGFYRSNIIFGSGEPLETNLAINGVNDIFISKFERSFNAAPAFELSGETTLLEDFSGTQNITVNQINTPDDELTQIVSYSISPESSDLVSLSFNNSTGVLVISALENQFGEEVFTITADDGEIENYDFSEEFSIIVEPVNDPPLIVEYLGAATIVESGFLEILLSDFTVTDIDNEFPTNFLLSVQEGENYQVTGNRISPTIGYVGRIDVPVKVNDGELDSEEFSISFEIAEILGLDNEFIKDKFSIYPNPTSDFLTVIPSDHSEYHLTIFTTSGRLVHFSIIKGNSNRIFDLSSLTEGLYLIKVQQGNKSGTMKLIISKD